MWVWFEDSTSVSGISMCWVVISFICDSSKRIVSRNPELLSTMLLYYTLVFLITVNGVKTTTIKPEASVLFIIKMPKHVQNRHFPYSDG